MHTFDHHPPCPGGCGELADECMCGRNNCQHVWQYGEGMRWCVCGRVERTDK